MNIPKRLQARKELAILLMKEKAKSNVIAAATKANEEKNPISEKESTTGGAGAVR
jgi:hypothetical protein